MGNKNSAADAKMKAKEWQWQLKTELKHLDKEIKKIEVDEARLRKEITAQAAKNNVDTVQMMARSIVKSQKTVQRLERTKGSMHAVILQLTTSIATMTTTSSLRISADCMRKMNNIAKVSELGVTMEDMRREMSRCAEAEDGIEEHFRDEGEEEAAANEVQRVLEEMALEKMGPLASTAAVAPAVAAPPAVEPAAPVAVQPQPQRIAVAEGGVPMPAQAAVAPAPVPAPAQAPAPAPAAATSSGYTAGLVPSTAASHGYAGAQPAAPASALAPVPAPAPAAAPTPSAGGLDDDDLMRRLQMLKQG